jgi:hypothetical protein
MLERDDVRMVGRPVTVAALSEALGLKPYEVIKDLVGHRVFAENVQRIVNDEAAASVARVHGMRLVIMERGATRVLKRPVTVKALAKALNAVVNDLIQDMALRRTSVQPEDTLADVDAIALAAMRGVRLVIEK